MVATLLGAGAFVPTAQAQDMTTATFNGTTIWVGGGVQFLSLPDIRFTEQNGRRQKNSESEWLDFGGAAGAGIDTALGIWGNSRVTGSIKGFFANVRRTITSDATATAPFSIRPPVKHFQVLPLFRLRPTARPTIGAARSS